MGNILVVGLAYFGLLKSEAVAVVKADKDNEEEMNIWDNFKPYNSDDEEDYR